MTSLERKKGALTTRGLAALKVGQWAADPAPRGAGRLQVIKLGTGGLGWYFRYTRSDGRRDTLPLGTDLSLADARAQASLLSRRYQSGTRDLRDSLVAEQEASVQAKRDVEMAEHAANKLVEATLGALLMAYCDQLDRAEKISAPDVRKALKRHVEEAWPAIWAKSAASVETDDLLQVVARLVEMGKLREGAKIRSYIRAAYGAAISARHDATALPHLRDLKISSNPARDLATIEGNTNCGDRNLSLAELRCYWQRINVPNFPYGLLLRFHLLTGGQRVSQLSRTTTADFDVDSKTIRIFDKKGRRKRPREHVVPLIPEALAAMHAMGSGPYLFTLTNGATPANISGMGDAIDALNDAMTNAGELSGGRFTARDIRRTVETRLSAAGVSLEDRAYLQSHGLGGVQSRHYDKYQRTQEARAALEKLRLLLDQPKIGATSIRKKPAKA